MEKGRTYGVFDERIINALILLLYFNIKKRQGYSLPLIDFMELSS